MVDRSADRAARWPAILLVALVVLSPWPFGSAHLRTTQAIALVGSLAVLLWLARQWLGERRPAAVARAERATADASLDASGWSGHARGFGRLWLRLLTGIWMLALLQLIPLPPWLHGLLAPGSAVVWHPAVPAVAAVLGPGPHPVSLDPSATLRWLAFTAGVLGLALISGPALRERTVLLRASTAVVVGALLVALYGLVARLLFADKLYGFLTVPTIAPFGPFVSKNHFAGYVELAACLALGLAAGLADESRRGHERLSWLESRRAPWVIAAWGAAAVLVLAVPVSLSRGGVVSLTAGVAAFVALRLSTGSRPRLQASAVGLAAAGLITALVTLVLVLPDEARQRVGTLGDVPHADTYRLEVWRDALRLAASSPAVGSGFGSFADALPRFKTGAGFVRVQHAENDYVELLCEGGLVGFGLAALGVAALLSVAWRSVRDEPHRLVRAVRAGALAGLFAVFVHSAFDFNLRIPSNALLAGLLLAFVLPDHHARPPVGGQLRSFMLSGAIVLALVLAALGPWYPQTLNTAGLQRAATAGASGLRGALLERDFIAHLRRRPADASAWAALAWLRLPRAPQEADALAAWSQSLDPQYASLRTAAQRVRDAAMAATEARGLAEAGQIPPSRP